MDAPIKTRIGHGDGSLHGVAERSSIVTNPDVTRDDGQEGWLVTQGSGGRQMNGVQGADRFNGKGTSGMGKDRLSDADDVTAAGKPLQGEQCRSLLLSRDPSPEARAENREVGLVKRDSGRYALALGTDGDPRGRVSLKHGRHQSAGFDVAGNGRPLGPGTARMPDAARLSRLTVRHGRGQSGQMLFQEGAGSRGSLPEDPRPQRVAR